MITCAVRPAQSVQGVTLQVFTRTPEVGGVFLMCRASIPRYNQRKETAMTFRTVATITSILLFILGAGYLFAGAIVVGRWALPATDEVLLVARRIGAIYLGLSVLFFMARSAPVSAARIAISAGATAVLSLLVVLGIYEFVAGHVGAGIFGSAGVELLLAIGFIGVLISERREDAGVTGKPGGASRT